MKSVALLSFVFALALKNVTGKRGRKARNGWMGVYLVVVIIRIGCFKYVRTDDATYSMSSSRCWYIGKRYASPHTLVTHCLNKVRVVYLLRCIKWITRRVSGRQMTSLL